MGREKRTSKKLKKCSNDVIGMTEEERENKEEGIFEGIVRAFTKLLTGHNTEIYKAQKTPRRINNMNSMLRSIILKL